MKLHVKKLPWYISWRGLLWKKPEPVLFTTRFGIHTFGMQYPIDVVIVDSEGIVQKLKENLQPNRFFFWNPLFNTVLELPVGSVQKRKLHRGEKIELQTF